MSTARYSRRQFVAGAAAATAAGAVGVTVARHPWTAAVGSSAHKAVDGKGTLVVVTLYGGNDGLNMVVPYENGTYLSARPTLAYQPKEVLPLGEGLGLAPSLKGLKALWDAKRLAVVRGVGYPDPNRSHFRSMDIWQTAVPDHAVGTGWLGRWLDATGTDPLRSLSVGPTLPRLLAGEKTSGSALPNGPVGLAGTDGRLTRAFAALASPRPEAPWAARVAQTGADFLTVQHTVADALAHQPDQPAAGSNLEGAPTSGGGTLGTQLDLVAKLIKAGVPTRVYAVSLGGFDTHAAEKDTQARLLGELDTALHSFDSSLHGTPRGDGVVVLVYSEFGRRVAANASGGTDHGTAAPVLVVGPGVKGGFYGDEPSLTDLDDGDLRFTTDFRSVYATVLTRVLGVDATVALDKSYRPLDFL